MDESFLDITGGESVAAFEEFPVKRCGSPIVHTSSRRLRSQLRSGKFKWASRIGLI